MTIEEQWAKGYARQAAADYRAWRLYEQYPAALAAECHALLFLQMACEKLCKAHLIRHGARTSDLQSSHGYVAKPLPQIIQQEILYLKSDVRPMGWVLNHIRHLAREIELLNPAVDRGGQRSDNCEYPWEIGGTIVSPLDHVFAPASLLTTPAGRTFLKLLASAINRNATDA